MHVHVCSADGEPRFRLEPRVESAKNYREIQGAHSTCAHTEDLVIAVRWNLRWI